MSIEFAITLEELIEMETFLEDTNKKHILYTKFSKFTIMLYHIFLIGAFFYAAYKTHWNKEVLTFLGMAFILISLVLYAIIFFSIKLRPYRIRKVCTSAVKKDPSLIASRTLTISDNKIIILKSNSKKEILFNTIDKFIENNGIIYIFNKKSRAILIIPRNIFKSTDEKLKFLNTITLSE